MKLKFMLLLFAVSLIFFMGCRKQEGRSISIMSINVESPEGGPQSETFTGTFTATGAFNSSGNQVTVVQPLGTDSIRGNATFTAPEGTFTIVMTLEKPTTSYATSAAGHWKVARGTGAYALLRGNGQVTMLFPPDVPRYTLSAETITGVVWLHP